MKGAIAAILLAVVEAPELRGDLIVTAVADEELGSIGTEAVLERVSADAAIVVEPTELQLAVAHRGFVLFEIETAGVARTARGPSSASTRSRRWATCSSRWRASTGGCRPATGTRSSGPPRCTPR